MSSGLSAVCPERLESVRWLTLLLAPAPASVGVVDS